MAHRPDDRPVVGFFEDESGAEYSFSVAGAAGLPTLDDVGGMSELKRQIRETVGLRLSGEEILKQLRVEVNGILLYGPPGTGKTMIARATAGEYKMRLLHVSGGEFSAKWMGESEQRIRGAFQTAARNAPCLLFFDELDTMAGKRGDMGGNEQQHRQVVGQLLRSLEEIRKHPRVIVMAATNDIESLDEAIVRSGHFDRRIRVDLPDAEARPAIFAARLRGLPQAADIDLQALAEETEGRTGADITAIVESAKLNTVDRLRGLSAGVTAQITAADLKKALADRRGADSPPLPPLTWDDLILPDDIKRQLQRLAELIADPGAGRDFGLKPATGALLHGPPGTGKTTAAQVIASETKGSMSFITVKGSDLKSKFVGESAKKVPDLFARARGSSPTIIFLDEIDALLPRRSGQGDDSASQEQDSVTTEFLVQLDGIESLPGIFVLGATNLPDKLDPAVTRRGRLSRKILIPLPNLENREALFRLHSSELKFAHEIDFAELARLTERLSGADIEAMCQEAAQIAFQRGEGRRAITDDDFRVVLRQRRVGVEVKSASWDDLILPEETLRQLKTLARLIGDPEAGKALGIRRPTGAVLYGPPGTGKTTIARVLASQSRGDVSFFQAKGSDVISKFIGESGQHVRNLFDQARARTPSIIFVDEIEALLPRRDQIEQSGGEREAVVTEFLQQIDGLDSTPGVFVLGATNLLERVDEAVLRGGRLSRHIEIPLPDAESRARLFALFTKEMTLDPDVDVDVLGDQSDGESGAGIESICHDAAEYAFMRNEGAQSVTAENFAAVLARRN